MLSNRYIEAQFGLLGLNSAAYSTGYVAGWAGGDAETMKATAGNVSRTVHQLVDALIEAETQVPA